MEMKVGVILSEAKDLQFRSGEQMQILRFAQNDRLSKERSEESAVVCFRMNKCRCLAKFTLSVGPPVGGFIVPETSNGLDVESMTYVKFLESEANGLRVTARFFHTFLRRGLHAYARATG